MEGFVPVSEMMPSPTELDSPHAHHPHSSEMLLSLLARHKTLEGSNFLFIIFQLDCIRGYY